jgi:hypothetical protein
MITSHELIAPVNASQHYFLTLCPCLEVQDSEKCSDLQKDLLLGTVDCCTIRRKTVTDTAKLRAKVQLEQHQPGGEPTLLAEAPGYLFPSLPSVNEPGLRRGVSLGSTRSVVYRTSSSPSTGLLKARQELKPADEKQENAKNDAHKLKKQSSRALSSASQKLTTEKAHDIMCTRSKFHADSGLTPAPPNVKLLHAHV